MFFLKLVSLPISHEPGITEKSIEDDGPVLWRKILQNLPKHFLSGMARRLKHVPDSSDGTHNFII